MFDPYIWWGIGLTLIAGLLWLADRYMDSPLSDDELYCALVDWQLDQLELDDDALREDALVEWLESIPVLREDPS